MPNRMKFGRVLTILWSFVAHCAGILAENQVDLRESMKHENHILVGWKRPRLRPALPPKGIWAGWPPGSLVQIRKISSTDLAFPEIYVSIWRMAESLNSRVGQVDACLLAVAIYLFCRYMCFSRFQSYWVLSERFLSQVHTYLDVDVVQFCNQVVTVQRR
uniref:Uncharacterized protein n=1 Tax=Arundo donax TaxID=35708 RepID=A0A0A9F7K1_ARUDO